MYIEKTICWRDVSNAEICFCLKCKSCRNKQQLSLFEAHKLTNILNNKKRQGERRLHSYECLYCNFYHVGHRPNKKRRTNLNKLSKAV